MNYVLDIVTDSPDLWKDGDPVRPELGVSYKTYPGRQVFGLRDASNQYVAFCCVARASEVPWDIMSLSNLTFEEGHIAVPYTVWSLKRGSGKAIISAILDHIRESGEIISRVVTLSPNTDMARRFHLRNGAREIATHIVTANFEYEIFNESR